MNSKLLRHAPMCVGALLTAGLIAACGSSSSSSSTSSAAAAASSTTSTASAASSTTTSTSVASSAASAVTSAALKTPTSIEISTALNSKPPTGKTIAFLRCSQPVCQGFEQGLQPATKALGWHLISVPFQPTPEAEVAAFTQAIQQHVDGIFVTGLPRVVMESGLKAAQAAHIPVVDGYTVNAVAPPIIANIANGAGNNFAPTAAASFIASDSGCKGTTAVYNIPVYPILNYTTSILVPLLKKLCPSMTLLQESAQATDVGTKLPGEVTSLLQSHPDVKYVAFAFGDMALGVPAALKSAGLSASVIGYGAGEPTNVQAVAAGQETADTGYGIPYGGWRAMDAFARQFEGMSPAIDTTAKNPGQLFTKENASGVTGWSNMAVAPDMPQQFMKLWHVSG